ncbi:MAG: gamma-glutamyltransferase [Rhodospirillaceae bacterium]|nr:gamma-glutamyltransferase [Rhodospirillaceae bacterium]
MNYYLFLISLFVFILNIHVSNIAIARDPNYPEASSGITPRESFSASNFMVSAANPIAVNEGYKILESGGNAIDAAITTQLVLNLVEPQSSGIGGGAFILYWDNEQKQLYAYDGRETAPNAATSELFTYPDGKAIARSDAMIGGKSVGVPGLISVMDLSHKNHGELPWHKLFSPAVNIAKNGFAISPRLFTLLKQSPSFSKAKVPAQYYYTANGLPKPIGYILKNPKLAVTYQKIAKDGVQGFYTGKIATAIINEIKTASQNPSNMTMDDLLNYRAKLREPVCASYRVYKICGMPAPTSGSTAVIQIMKLLERFDLPNMAPWSSSIIHVFIEATRLAYADRSVYMADPDFVSVPQLPLISSTYLSERSKLIDLSKRMKSVIAGSPTNKLGRPFKRGFSFELPSTSHIVTIDGKGNAVSMTSSIESAFGSHLMVEGFLLNNQLTDFSIAPNANDTNIANRVQPGKRPRSSMAPIMVFDKNDNLVVALGSAGGISIIPFVAKTLISILDWKMNAQAAISLPNIVIFRDTVILEKNTPLIKHKNSLESLGHKIVTARFPSGTHAVNIKNGLLWGGADPRREGIVMGN